MRIFEGIVNYTLKSCLCVVGGKYEFVGCLCVNDENYEFL